MKIYPQSSIVQNYGAFYFNQRCYMQGCLREHNAKYCSTSTPFDICSSCVQFLKSFSRKPVREVRLAVLGGAQVGKSGNTYSSSWQVR